MAVSIFVLLSLLSKQAPLLVVVILGLVAMLIEALFVRVSLAGAPPRQRP